MAECAANVARLDAITREAVGRAAAWIHRIKELPRLARHIARQAMPTTVIIGKAGAIHPHRYGCAVGAIVAEIMRPVDLFTRKGSDGFLHILRARPLLAHIALAIDRPGWDAPRDRHLHITRTTGNILTSSQGTPAISRDTAIQANPHRTRLPHRDIKLANVELRPHFATLAGVLVLATDAPAVHHARLDVLDTTIAVVIPIHVAVEVHRANVEGARAVTRVARATNDDIDEASLVVVDRDTRLIIIPLARLREPHHCTGATTAAELGQLRLYLIVRPSCHQPTQCRTHPHSAQQPHQASTHQ